MKPRHTHLARREHTGLVIVDVQEAFRPVIDSFDETVANVGLLAEGFAILGRPIIVTEQYPKGLGSTVPEVAGRLPQGFAPIPKTRFSASGVHEFDQAVDRAACRTWVVAGIEAHVCVEQTALDLMERGHDVHVAADAVSSRTPRNRALGIDKMISLGVHVTSAEMALFEMIEDAGAPEFKAISRLVR
ncbi:MAG: hydrolase [Thermoleophilia bacterium]|jgi:nicotinamidase-related amidase